MVAFGRGKENLDFLKKNDYEAYGCTLLTSELDVNYEKGGNVYRSAMQKQPNVLSGEYDADRNTMYGMAPVILEYYLGNETDVEALDFHPLTARLLTVCVIITQFHLQAACIFIITIQGTMI